MVPGRYVFRLRVTDEQGATDEDTVSVIVKHGKQYNDLCASIKMTAGLRNLRWQIHHDASFTMDHSKFLFELILM